MKTSIKRDIMRYRRGGAKDSCYSKCMLVLTCPGLQVLVIFRFFKWIEVKKRNFVGSTFMFLLVPVERLLRLIFQWLFDIRIEESVEIGPGLYIGHLGGIRLCNCELGEYCSIQQEVQIMPAPGSSVGPVIGSRVWIGAHAKINGDVRIGDGVTIGAGACVNRDIPSGCLVLGDPARVVQSGYDNSSFL